MIIALIGPPGSGKTHLGRLIARSLGFTFTETEKELLDRYGSREAFLKDKRVALADLEQRLRSRAESDPLPVVIEATGLSDGPMLERLRSDFPLLLVKVSAPRDLCAERVRGREPGRNLSNDPDEAAKFHDFWVREVEPRYDFDLEILNDGRLEPQFLRALSELAAGRPPGL